MFETIWSIITMAAVLAVFVFYFFVKKKEGKDWIYAIYFLTILISGTVLYSRGLYYKKDSDATFNPLFVILRSITCSLKALSGDFQISSISALSKDNSFVAAAVVIHFVMAELLTFLIIIKLFGKNLINRLKVFFNSFRSKYIIIGTSGAAKIFLDSLSRDKKRRTTIILEAKHADKKKELMFSGFSVVVIGDEENAAKKSLRKGKENPLARDISQTTRDALRVAGFERNKRTTRVLAMSESDETNLLVAKIVTDYIKVKIAPKRNDKGKLKLDAAQESALEATKLFAHIMYEALERTEHFVFSEYALGRVIFFNPHEIRARKFMDENPITSLIPREWINTEKGRIFCAEDGKTPPNIGNIFIGFGQTNSHILKKSICHYQLLGTDYNALIIDKDGKRLARQFQNSASGLFDSRDGEGNITSRGAELLPNRGDAYFDNPKENCNISFGDLNVLSADFYDRIADEIRGTSEGKGLDFVSIVIALSSDKLSVETALELRQKLYERELLTGRAEEREYARVRIFVKIQKETVLSDYVLLNGDKDFGSEITVFGAESEILNESFIINEKLDFIAKRISNDYWAIAGKDEQKTNSVSRWDALTEFKRNSNRYAAMSIRTKLNLLGFDLVSCGESGGESCGETDAETAVAFEAAYGAKKAEQLRKIKESGKFCDLTERDGKGNILDTPRNNLARLEHQRWNTFHLASGWTKLAKLKVNGGTRQNERAKQHACITTFEGLSQLRECQAKDIIASAKEAGKPVDIDKIMSEADTVCYDFDVMDRLLGNLKDSEFRVVKLNS